MFHEEYTALCNVGVAKNNLLKKNPLGYFISSMVAGMFISFGSMVAFVLGQSMDGNGAAAAVKLIQSVAFASALSLVVMAWRFLHFLYHSSIIYDSVIPRGIGFHIPFSFLISVLNYSPVTIW